MKKKKRTKTGKRRKKRNKGKLDTRRIAVAAGIVSMIAVLFFLTRFLIIYLDESRYDASDPYPVRGVDVSHYQGNVDWEELEKQDICFAFIKATEGENLVDSRFEDNWENIEKTDIRKGAYHFLRFEKSGKVQAENFINTVPKEHGNLPPVVDVELYGEYLEPGKKPSVKTVQNILTPLLKELEEYYGEKPVIYTNRYVYYAYLMLEYRDYELWMSNPDMDITKHRKNPGWTFCQYSFKGELKGIDSRYVDLNVFNGTRWEFRNY